MTGRIEQIPELFQEQLEADGYDSEDIEQVRRHLETTKPDGAFECPVHMQNFLRRLHTTRPVLEETA